MAKQCIACGMPMKKDEDFARGDLTLEHCRNCARPDGSMKSYEEVLAGMCGFMIRTQGLDEDAAKASAIAMMAKLPAWQPK